MTGAPLLARLPGVGVRHLAGLWLLVIFNTALFIVFAVGFFHPRTKRD